MAGVNERYTTAQVIEAIEGTGGVKTVIAQRLGCHRHTVDRYIARHPTVARAYQDECEKVGDFAESILLGNIRYALEQQRRENAPVDSTDAKWYLERKRREQFARRREVDLNAEGILVQLVGVDPDAGDES